MGCYQIQLCRASKFWFGFFSVGPVSMAGRIFYLNVAAAKLVITIIVFSLIYRYYDFICLVLIFLWDESFSRPVAVK
jgi:hypothetical protein